MGKDEKLLNEADRVIGDAEKIVIVAGKINPEKVMARNGTVRPAAFQLSRGTFGMGASRGG